MKRPTTGELRERLVIEQASNADDGEGGYTTTWVQIGTPWAKCDIGNPRQRLYHGQPQDTIDALFTIRNAQTFVLDTRLSKDYRVTDQRNQVYRVKGIKPLDNRLDFIVLECQMWGAVSQ